MDRASVEANLSLKSAAGKVNLQFKWDEKNTQVEDKPVQSLNLKTDYTFSVDAAARSADGSSLAKGISRALTRIAHEILEQNAGAESLAIIGILTGNALTWAPTSIA